ncbi:hypothetical protein ACJ3XI_11605 [Litorimonas sp. RW-G-Af-16]|uniref:hypothetical protein n=1 Tax=Litorimonas sp. RW-G-Af-16 TaxID=3241168 RepID=UPI00390C739B
MPRGRGPIKARDAARLRAWRRELLQHKVTDAHRKARAQSRLPKALAQVSGYAALCQAELQLDVQAELDRMELKLINSQRAEVGLEPLSKLPLN